MRIAFCLIGCLACGGKPGPGWTGIAQALQRGDAPRTTSVLVLRGDAIVYEQYFQGATAAALHDTRSATKSLTALAVGIAIDRHALPGLDAPAFADLQPFAAAGPLQDAITIEDLLTRSSALDCNDDDDPSPRSAPTTVATPPAAVHSTTARRACSCSARSCSAPPGSPSISSWPRTCSRCSGSPGGFARSPAGEPMTGGGLRLTSRDLAALARLVRDGGADGTAQVVPAAFVRAATTVHRNAFPGQDYGYLFWHRVYQASCTTAEGWFMSGNGGNAIVVLPALDAVVVITRTNYDTKGMHQQTTKLIEDQILPALACAK